MKSIIHTLLLLLIANYSLNVNAELVIEGANDFKVKVNNYLSEAKSSSTYLAELIQNLDSSHSIITIKAITNNPATWHKSGKKSRSHTKAIDNKARGAARSTATSSIVYINPNRITQTHKTYNSGTLIHEITHAYDLANGQYHSNYSIREKRAVFFQNIWRNSHAKELRTDYHGRFSTNDYLQANKAGQLKQFVNYYYSHNDIPESGVQKEK